MTSAHITATPTATPARPRALVAALAASAATAVLTIVSQLLALSGAEQAARDEVTKQAGGLSGLSSSLVDSAVAQARDTLHTRAWLGIVVAAVVLVLTALAARAGRVARISLAVFLAIGALLMLRSVTDVFPSDAKAVGVVAVVLAPVAVVLLFLPAVGRY